MKEISNINYIKQYKEIIMRIIDKILEEAKIEAEKGLTDYQQMFNFNLIVDIHKENVKNQVQNILLAKKYTIKTIRGLIGYIEVSV